MAVKVDDRVQNAGVELDLSSYNIEYENYSQKLCVDCFDLSIANGFYLPQSGCYCLM